VIKLHTKITEKDFQRILEMHAHVLWVTSTSATFSDKLCEWAELVFMLAKADKKNVLSSSSSSRFRPPLIPRSFSEFKFEDNSSVITDLPLSDTSLAAWHRGNIPGMTGGIAGWSKISKKLVMVVTTNEENAEKNEKE